MGLAVLATVLIVWLRYLLVSGFFALWTHRAHPGLYHGQGQQIRREIWWSTAAAVIYGAPAGAVLWLWASGQDTAIYTRPADHPLWWLAGAPLLYLFIHDGWFYWSHRLLHLPALYRRCHLVHHRSHPPTAWAAMSFHWTESISGAWLIPALALIIPIHIAGLGVVMTIMTLFGVTNHLGWEIWPRRWVYGPLGAWIITATHHDTHHRKNKGNYGLYFRFWDRLCGTDLGFSNFGADRAASQRSSRAGGPTRPGRNRPADDHHQQSAQ